LTGRTPRVMMCPMIRVIINGREHQLDTKRIRVETLLRRLHINPETALALHRGELLTEDEEIVEGDTCVIRRTVAER
jgi:sulfur carrier protein ThiS